MLTKNMPIGVFDSGVGGVSVLKELVRIMPNENYIYLGDTKNAPYGTKSHEEIFLCAHGCAAYLRAKGVKALVVACNTATSVSVEALRNEYSDINVVGIEPAIKPALLSGRNLNVAVMATPLTLKETKFSNLCKRYSSLGNVIPVPCPGLMEIVEAGKAETEECFAYLEKIFENINADAIVLGCTHYPFVKRNLMRLFPHAGIFDGGEGTARQVRRLLEKDNLLTESDTQGKIIFENTMNDEKTDNLAKFLLKSGI